MTNPEYIKSPKTYSRTTSTSGESIPSKRTLLIFDFDDTLFCTKYFDTYSISYQDIFEYRISLEEINPCLIKDIKDLENTIINMFKQFLNNYDIIIVSNADLKWINNCLKHFLPELKEIINKNEIKIFSAKNIWSKSVKSSNEWKTKCFKKVVNEIYSNELNLDLTVISIGDSNDEKKAVFKLVNNSMFQKLTTKFVQMISFPSATSIVLQLKYISDNINDFINEDKNIFKLNIEFKNNNVLINCVKSYYKKNLGKEMKNLLENKGEEDFDLFNEKLDIKDCLFEEKEEKNFLKKKLKFY